MPPAWQKKSAWFRRKKKKNVDTNGATPTPTNGAVKRKAEDDGDDAQSDKKAKLEEAAS